MARVPVGSSLRFALVTLAGAALPLGCGAPPPPAPPQAGAPASSAVAVPGPPRLGPARYLVPGWLRVERTPDGLDRVVIGGRRVELRGLEVTMSAPAEPEVGAGAVAPSWAGEGPQRYLFWRGRELYGAASFGAALHRIATLPAEPQGAFPWVDGAGLVLAGGAVVVSPAGGAPLSLGRPGVARAAAIDARRGLALSALGRGFLTLDGGKSFRDLGAEVGPITRVEARGDTLAIGLAEGSERFLDAAGTFGERRSGPAKQGGSATEDPLDDWPLGGAAGAIEGAVLTGAPLADGGVILAGRGFAGRFDPRALRTTSVASIAALVGDAECSAFQARDTELLVCADHERATVLDLRGVPRVERTFDRAGAAELDRFVGVDGEALGYLGPCAGRAFVDPGGDVLVAGEPRNPSPSRSPIFCVREGREQWIEHRLDADEAGDVIAWIPRPGGDAAAIVAFRGAVLPAADRVRVAGRLRVVRVARNEPPLAFAAYGQREASLLDRSRSIAADDTIEGFFPGASSSQSALALSIDAEGRVRAHPSPPRTTAIVSAGRLALAHTDDGRLFETLDFGHRWSEVERPPGSPNVAPSQCSPVGCSVGSFVRLGWGGSAPPSDEADAARRARARESASFQRPRPPPAAVRLRCRVDGEAEGKRAPETFGFGYNPAATQRGMVAVRLGTVGAAAYPWSSNGSMAGQGDVDLGWLTPLDLDGIVQRRTIPFARAGITGVSPRLREVRLAYLLALDGGLDLLPIGGRDQCSATLLSLAGVVRPLAGCVDDRSVGVDLGDRVVTLRVAGDALITSTLVGLPRRVDAKTLGSKGFRAASPSAIALPTAPRELHRTPTPGSLRGFALGAGARDGQPVAVLLDASGEAILAPIDAALGTLGPEESLAPLRALALGADASCSGGVRVGEARVVLPFEGLIGLDRAALPGVIAGNGAGVAVIRWSRERACLDAVELPVRDERFEPELAPYEGSGTVRKLIGRFASASASPRAKASSAKAPGAKAPSAPNGVGGPASLVLIGAGYELRQRLRCDGLVPGEPPAP